MINAIAIDDEPLALHVIETFCATLEFIHLQKTFTKPTEALKYLRKFPADLIFLDINMPAMSGFELIKEVQQNSMVIFTTAFSEYAAKSYELNAVDYLLKPINQKRFEQAVQKANDYFNYKNKVSTSVQKDLFIRADYSLVRVPLEDILYIEALRDYLKVFVKDRKTLVTRMTMKEITDSLPSSDFIRVHRSYILPKRKIKSIRNKIIDLDGKEIPIGGTYMDEVSKLFKP